MTGTRALHQVAPACAHMGARARARSRARSARGPRAHAQRARCCYDDCVPAMLLFAAKRPSYAPQDTQSLFFLTIFQCGSHRRYGCIRTRALTVATR